MDQHALPSPPVPDARKIIEDVFGILGILRRGWRYIAVSVALALTLAYIHQSQNKPTYQASARVLILQQGGQPLNVGGKGGELFSSGDFYSNSLATHIMIIRSPLMGAKAVALGGLKDISPGAVTGGLTVTIPDQQARVLEIGYRTGTPGVALEVVGAVILSYEQFLKEKYQKNTHEVIELIRNARDELSTDLKKLENEYLEFRQRSPAHTGDGAGRTFVARRLDQWDQTINQATVRELQLKLQLELGRKLAGEGAGVAAVANALNQLSGFGGDVKFAPEVVDSKGDAAGAASGLSYERLDAELSEVALRRLMTEELLAALQAELTAAASSAKVSDEDVVSAFYADPEVAEIKADLRRTKARLDQAKRTTRQASDPSVRNYDRKTKELEAELERSWRRLRPAIVAQLSHTGNDPTLVEAEAELRGLKAKESALRKQREQLRLDRLHQLRQQHDQLAQQFGPEDEKLVAVKRQIARFEHIPEETSHPAQSQTGALLSSIEQGLKSVETMRAEIEERFRRDLTESKKSEIDLLAESNLRNNLERQRTLFNSVVDQLKQAQLVSDYGSVSAQVLNPPTAWESRPSMGPGLMMALMIGLGVGGGIAFVADLLDARVRSVSEIRKVVDLRMLGLIPQHARGQLDSDFAMGLMSHTTPQSLMAEAYKSVRTSLDHLRRSLNVQVLLITSPQSGDGKSTTASNLAISLAHAGRRVLLIDADLRRPSQHLIHGLRRSPGLTHILKDVLPFHRVVQQTLIDNLDFLATGSEVSNPAELLASPRLNVLLEEVRPLYDVVIFDSSPLLAVTDSSIIASVVDGVLLVVRVSATRRHDIERTLEHLKTLGTLVLGTVVNGMVREQFGYGYGYGTYGSSNPPEEQATSAAKPRAKLTVSQAGPSAFGANGTNGTNGTNGINGTGDRSDRT